jgi:hypothetical protein
LTIIKKEKSPMSDDLDQLLRHHEQVMHEPAVTDFVHLVRARFPDLAGLDDESVLFVIAQTVQRGQAELGQDERGATSHVSTSTRMTTLEDALGADRNTLKTEEGIPWPEA